MKTLALASLLLAFAAPSFAASEASCSKSYVFEIDARPVDGNLIRVSLLEDQEGTFSADRTVITAGFGFPVETTVTELGQSLTCVETEDKGVLSSLNCSIDMRPADGFLTEVIATRNEAGRYDIVLHRSAYSMIDSSIFDETTEVASNLKRVK